MAPPDKPAKGMMRKTPLKSTKGFDRKGTLSAGAGLKAKPPTLADAKKALERATVRALEKARKEAEANGVSLSEWENDFITGVSERVKTYGRAFSDPDKGAAGTTLSLRQGLKLKEIRKKATSAKSRPNPDK
jgi:hypothetical protein